MRRICYPIPLLLVFLSIALGLAQENTFSVRITFGHGQPEDTAWSGSISSRQADIAEIEGWLFLPADKLSFRNFELTAGGLLQSGVIVTGLTSPGGQLVVETNGGTFELALADFQPGVQRSFLEGTVHVEALPDVVQLTDDARDDDFPSIATSGKTVWTVWQSYSGQMDQIRLSRFDESWHTFTRLPGVSGDVWMPQIAIDGEGYPVVVWSQQVDGNFDIYARRLNTGTNTWEKMVRLSSHPFSDINHHVASDKKGTIWVVWQGFRGKTSDIFLRRYSGSSWSEEICVTDDPANDWNPRVAVNDRDQAHIVWDTYRAGNYDVYLRTYAEGELGPEIPIASSPRFEANASVAVDGQDRIWIAWEEAGPNWGKDAGPTVDPNWRERPQSERWQASPGIPLYDVRNIGMVVLDGTARKQPIGDFHPLDREGSSFDTPIFVIDPDSNQIALLLHRRGHAGKNRQGTIYWETVLTYYRDGHWSPFQAIPESWGRGSAVPAADFGPEGDLWLAWPSDGRRFANSHRPIVGNVFSARLPSHGLSPAPELREWQEPEPVEVKVGHLNEPADLATIRSYRTFVHGVEKQIVRGDFHRHTELSWDSGGRYDGTLIDFYRYMIDAAGMDFGAVTDHQAGGGYEYWWWLIQKSCDLYHIPRAFTTFYGYERSARFPNGHRNIFHTTRGIPVVSFFTETSLTTPDPPVATGTLVDNDTKLLYESLHRTGGISIPHTSTSIFMGTDWRDNDPEVEPVVEIFQGDRVSSEHRGAPRAARSEDDNPPGGYQEAGFMWNAYRKGYRLGTIASSDHVSTHISYALVYTEQPTRDEIFRGFKSRHTYGATDNIVLDYRIGDSFMGEELTTGSAVPPLKIRVIGTAPVASVEVIKNEQIIYTAHPDQQDVSLTYLDEDSSPGSSYYYVRVIQNDRQIAWSSPIWVNYKP